MHGLKKQITFKCEIQTDVQSSDKQKSRQKLGLFWFASITFD